MEKGKIIKKLILSSLIKLLVLIIIFASALLVLVSRLKAQALALREKQTQIAIFQGKENSKAGLEKNYKEIEPSLPKIMTALPQKDDLAQFVSDLEKTILGLSLRFEEKSPSPDTLLFEIKTPGNFVGFVNFTKALEDLPYLIKITGFEIIGNTATIKATLGISI